MDDYKVDEMEMEGFLTDTPAHYYTSNPSKETHNTTTGNNSRRRTTTISTSTKQLKRRRQVVLGLVAAVIGISTTILRLEKFQVSTNVPNEPHSLFEPIDEIQLKNKTHSSDDGVNNNDYHHDAYNYNNAAEPSLVDVSAPTSSPITIDEEEEDQKVDEQIEQPKSQTKIHHGTSSKVEWGYWKFYDGYEKNRPGEDYWSKYPSKDFKAVDLPLNAWQADPV